jgi:flagellar basal-body rod protein FlgG
MIRGLYTAASGMIAGLRMQETVAENLSNLGTPGYKGERSGLEEFQGVLARSVGASSTPLPVSVERVLGRVGTGAYVDERDTVLAEGAERRTDLPLDVMVRGDGFFSIQTDDGIRYTRDGRFGRNAENILVSSDGQPVIGADGGPITINTDDVRILPTGDILVTVSREVEQDDGTLAIEVTEEVVGQLAVVEIDPQALVRSGGSRFTLVPGAGTTPVTLGETAVLIQGSLEETNIDIAQASTDLMSLARAYQSSQQVFSALNDSLQLAVRDIGRVG